MKKRITVFMVALTMLFCGCSSEKKPVTTQTPTTTAQTEAVELAETVAESAVPETTEPEPADLTVWLPPYWTDKGKLEFHCLVKNETMGNLSVESMQTVYYLNGEPIQEKEYDKNAMKAFLWRPFNELDLSLAASTLLIVDDYPSADGFDHVLVTITTRDDRGQETILTYNFTMDEAEVTPSTLTDDWELSTSWLVDIGGWNWDHWPVNTTDDILELEIIHSVCYDNGIPVTAGSKTPKEYSNYISTVSTLYPHQSSLYTEGVSEQHRSYNQREVTYVYCNGDGEPYLQKFYFVYEEALSHEEYKSRDAVTVLLETDEVKNGLGPLQYTESEIQKMVDDNLSLDEVAEKISTLGDLLRYLRLRGYGMDERGDLKFMADSVQWHVNRSPQVVYEENVGNCGSGSGLINYILRGDYDEQGYVQEAGSVGGHIYNWFKIDDVYYFFDMTHVVGDGSYSNSYHRVFATKDPQAFSEHYIGQNHALNSQSDRNWLVLQYMYQREGNHLPMGFVSFLGIIPEDMKDDITVLYVSGDRYAPVFMEAPPEENWPADAQ